MTMAILTAVAVMVCATLAQHLGLTEAISKVCTKISACSMCCSFWCTLTVELLATSEPWHIAILLAVLAAYASHWLSLLLYSISNQYEQLWRKMNHQNQNIQQSGMPDADTGTSS